MKKSITILILGLLLGLGAFAVPYFAATSNSGEGGAGDHALEWLRKEFKLDAVEFQRVAELHDGYQVECGRMCARIAAKDDQLQRMITSTNRVTPEIEQVMREKADLRQECQLNMLAHFYKVSQAMPEKEGKRYLDWVQRHTLNMGSAMAHPDSTDDRHVMH